MEFSLFSKDLVLLIPDVKKIRAHLKNGVAEIFENHQELLASVENDLIEIEENNSQKTVFVIQSAVFAVGKEQIPGSTVKTSLPSVYAIANRAVQLGVNYDFEKEYQEKQVELKKQDEKLGENTILTKSEIALGAAKNASLKEELKFLKKVLETSRP